MLLVFVKGLSALKYTRKSFCGFAGQKYLNPHLTLDHT